MTSVQDAPGQLINEDVASHQKPPQYFAVLVVNDKTTPRIFVQEALSRCFQIFNEEALRIIEQAEKQERTLVRLYPRDIAESKTAQANDFAKSFAHPVNKKPMELTFICEPV